MVVRRAEGRLPVQRKNTLSNFLTLLLQGQRVDWQYSIVMMLVIGGLICTPLILGSIRDRAYEVHKREVEATSNAREIRVRSAGERAKAIFDDALVAKIQQAHPEATALGNYTFVIDVQGPVRTFNVRTVKALYPGDPRLDIFEIETARLNGLGLREVVVSDQLGRTIFGRNAWPEAWKGDDFTGPPLRLSFSDRMIEGGFTVVGRQKREGDALYVSPELGAELRRDIDGYGSVALGLAPNREQMQHRLPALRTTSCRVQMPGPALCSREAEERLVADLEARSHRVAEAAPLPGLAKPLDGRALRIDLREQRRLSSGVAEAPLSAICSEVLTPLLETRCKAAIVEPVIEVETSAVIPPRIAQSRASEPPQTSVKGATPAPLPGERTGVAAAPLGTGDPTPPVAASADAGDVAAKAPAADAEEPATPTPKAVATGATATAVAKPHEPTPAQSHVPLPPPTMAPAAVTAGPAEAAVAPDLPSTSPAPAAIHAPTKAERLLVRLVGIAPQLLELVRSRMDIEPPAAKLPSDTLETEGHLVVIAPRDSGLALGQDFDILLPDATIAAKVAGLYGCERDCALLTDTGSAFRVANVAERVVEAVGRAPTFLRPARRDIDYDEILVYTKGIETVRATTAALEKQLGNDYVVSPNILAIQALERDNARLSAVFWVTLVFAVVFLLLAQAALSKINIDRRNRQMAQLLILGFSRGFVRLLVIGEFMVITAASALFALAVSSALCWGLRSVLLEVMADQKGDASFLRVVNAMQIDPAMFWWISGLVLACSLVVAAVVARIASAADPVELLD